MCWWWTICYMCTADRNILVISETGSVGRSEGGSVPTVLSNLHHLAEGEQGHSHFCCKMRNKLPQRICSIMAQIAFCHWWHVMEQLWRWIRLILDFTFSKDAFLIKFGHRELKESTSQVYSCVKFMVDLDTDKMKVTQNFQDKNLLLQSMSWI